MNELIWQGHIEIKNEKPKRTRLYRTKEDAQFALGRLLASVPAYKVIIASYLTKQGERHEQN